VKVEHPIMTQEKNVFGGQTAGMVQSRGNMHKMGLKLRKN
jgi:hypothetical protein